MGKKVVNKCGCCEEEIWNRKRHAKFCLKCVEIRKRVQYDVWYDKVKKGRELEE